MRDDELQVLGVASKRRSHWPWIVVAICVVIIAILSWLLVKKTSAESTLTVNDEGTTIVPELQETVDSVLRGTLKQYSGLHGQVIVMEVKTGAIKAMVGLERRYDEQYVPCDNFAYQQELGPTMMTASLLAAMETHSVGLYRRVDTGDGVWPVDDEHTMVDRKGGFGEILVGQALCFSSYIGIAKTVLKAFHNDANAYFAQLEKMSFGQPDSIEGIVGLRPATYLTPRESSWKNYMFPWHTIGYECKIAPIQMLTFYNAIANDGVMVKPMLKARAPEVINEQIASNANISEMRWVLRKVVEEGWGKRADTEVVPVAGKTGTSQLNVIWGDEDNEEAVYEYQLGFCGFFPADNPKYSMIVSLNTIWGIHSSGLVAGTAFRQIVEWMCEHMGAI